MLKLTDYKYCSSALQRYMLILISCSCIRGAVIPCLEKRMELAHVQLDWELDAAYKVKLEAKRSTIKASCVGGKEAGPCDEQYAGGAMGFVATDGSLSAGTMKIELVSL